MSELHSFLWLRIFHCMGGLCFVYPSPTAGQWAVSTFKLLWVVLLWTFVYKYLSELPRWLRGKESACQCRRPRRCRLNPWVRKIPWRRKWPPTPVSLPGKSHGQRSLVGYSPWGCKELDTTEQVHMHNLFGHFFSKFFWGIYLRVGFLGCKVILHLHFWRMEISLFHQMRASIKIQTSSKEHSARLWWPWFLMVFILKGSENTILSFDLW